MVDNEALPTESERRAADRAADAVLVERIRAGDEAAFGELYDRWIDRVHDLARRIAGDDAAADVAHDAFLATWRNLDALRDPAAFGGWLLRSARNAALDRRAREQRSRATDAEGLAVIEATGPSGAGAPPGFRVEDGLGAEEDPARAVERGEAAELVWESAAALGERDATVLDLTLRHGLAPAEVGDVIGMNRNAANQAVHRARTRLGDAIRARVLWRGGEPRCAGLATLLADEGIDRFDAQAVRAIATHAESCEACEERRRLRLAPAALFGAVPIAVVPALANERVAGALAADGVPMSGSAALAVPSRRPWWRRPLVAAGAGAALVVLAALAGWFVTAGNGDGDGDGGAVAAAALIPTTTSTTTTTTTTSPLPAPPSADGDVAPPGGPAGAPPATEPPPVLSPPSPVEASIRVEPGASQSTYTRQDAPRLVWSAVGGSRVEVSGPGLATIVASDGDEPLCPNGQPGWTVCPYEAGTWTYHLRVYDGAGALLVEETAALAR